MFIHLPEKCIHMEMMIKDDDNGGNRSLRTGSVTSLYNVVVCVTVEPL